MMNISESHSFYLLLISNAALLGAAAIAVTRFRRQCEKFEAFWSSPTGAAVADQKTDDSRKQLLVNLRLEKQLTDLQEKLETMASRPLSQAPPIPDHLPMDSAVRMAKNGASVEQLTRSCGLNIGEAKLMKTLHGRPQAVASA